MKQEGWTQGKHMRLTTREVDVLEYARRGYTNREISLDLDLHYRTIIQYKNTIIEKLEATGGFEPPRINFRAYVNGS